MQLLAKRKNCFQSKSCIIPELTPQRRQIACRKKELLKLPVNLAKLQTSLTGATISQRMSQTKQPIQPTAKAATRLCHLNPVTAFSAFQASTAVLPLFWGLATYGLVNLCKLKN